jgi:tetratricopeptide (TPR) repeat protein
MEAKGNHDNQEKSIVGAKNEKDSFNTDITEAKTVTKRDIRAEAHALLSEIAEQKAANDLSVKLAEEKEKEKAEKKVAIVKYELCSAAQALELDRLLEEIHSLTRELGTEHPRTLNLLDAYAELNFVTRSFELAEQYFRKAWEGRKRAQTSYIIEERDCFGPASHVGSVGTTLKVFTFSIFLSETNLAKTLLQLMRYEEARVLYEEALVGVEHLVQGGVYYDPHSPQSDARLEPIIDGLAVALHEIGHREKRYERALSVYERLIAMNRKNFGEMDPRTLSCVNRIAFVYRDMNRLSEAEAICVASLGTCTKVLGKDHPTTQLSVEIVAFIRHSQGKSQEAEDMFRLALECNERKLGLAHPTTLATVVKIAVLLSDQKLWKDSEAMHRRALRGFEDFYGDEHMSTMDEVQYVAELMLREENIPEAETLLRRALAGRRKLYPEGHPKIMDSAHCLGVLVQKQTKWKHSPLIRARMLEAELLYKEALKGREAAFGDMGDAFVETAAALADFLFENDRMTEAEGLWTKVLASYRKKLGDLNAQTAHAAYSLGIILQHQHRFYRGIDVFALALRGYQAAYGHAPAKNRGVSDGEDGGDSKEYSKEHSKGDGVGDGEQGSLEQEHYMITEARGAWENCLRMNAIS